MQHTRVGARRALRRTQRQHTSMLVSQLPEPLYDYDLGSDWESALVYGESACVTWRMLNNPFRVVPSWLRDDAEAEYEAERIVWALAGEPLCGRWGVPLSVCNGIRGLIVDLLQLLHADTALSLFVYVPRCDHT